MCIHTGFCASYRKNRPPRSPSKTTLNFSQTILKPFSVFIIIVISNSCFYPPWAACLFTGPICHKNQILAQILMYHFQRLSDVMPCELKKFPYWHNRFRAIVINMFRLNNVHKILTPAAGWFCCGRQTV